MVIGDEKMRINWWIVISFITIVCSYFNNSFHLWNLKYIGIIIIDILALKKDIIDNKFISKNAFKFFLLLSIWLILGSIISGSGLNLFLAVILYTMELTVMFYYSKNIFRNINDILSASIGCFLGSVIGLFYQPSLLHGQRFGKYRIRIYGIFGHPNTLGATALAAFVGAFLYLFLVKEKQKKLHIFAIVIIVFSIICILICDSRNALYGMMLFIFIFFYSKISDFFKINTIVKYLLFFGSIVLAALFILNSFDSTDFEDLGIRINSINYLKEFSIINILLGNGLKGGGVLGWGAEFSITQTIYKIGIIGLIVIIYFLYSNYRKGIKFLRDDFKNGFLAVFVIFLVCCIPEPYIVNITNIFSIYFFVLLFSFPYVEDNNM